MMLTITELRAGYGKTVVVDDLSVGLIPGEVVALVGRNGMGKTTLLRALFGQCDVLAGTIVADGRPLPRRNPSAPAKLGMTLMPDDRGVFPTLTIEENLRLASRKGYRPPVDVHELFPLLSNRATEDAGNLSGGQKQQLGIARAILAGRRFIAIDELSQGLQPSIAQATLEALRAVAASGVTVVFVEQSPRYPLAYSDRVVGMRKGGIVLDRPTAELRQDPSALDELLVVS